MSAKLLKEPLLPEEKQVLSHLRGVHATPLCFSRYKTEQILCFLALLCCKEYVATLTLMACSYMIQLTD